MEEEDSFFRLDKNLVFSSSSNVSSPRTPAPDTIPDTITESVKKQLQVKLSVKINIKKRLKRLTFRLKTVSAKDDLVSIPFILQE